MADKQNHARGLPSQSGGLAGRQGHGGAGRASFAAASATQGLAVGATTTNMARVPQAAVETSQQKGDDHQQVDMEVEVLNAGAGDPACCKLGGKTKTCSRCSQKGHAATDCVNEVYLLPGAKAPLSPWLMRWGTRWPVLASFTSHITCPASEEERIKECSGDSCWGLDF